MNQPLLVCEGPSDRAFFKNLIAVRGLPPMDIRFPAGEPGVGHGSGALGAYLDAIKTERESRAAPGVVIAKDSDSNPSESFKEMVAQLEKYNLQSPPAPGKLVKGTTFGTLSVLLLPDANTPGRLETLCLRVLERNYAALTPCVENLLTCSGLDQWQNDNYREKIKVYLYLSYACAQPTQLYHAWERKQNPISLDDAAFDDIANKLSDLVREMSGV